MNTRLVHLISGLLLFYVVNVLANVEELGFCRSYRNGRIAYSKIENECSNGEIWTMNSDGSDPNQITFSQNTTFKIINTHPAYSPDGKLIAFTSNRSGQFEIWVMNSDGSDPRQLTNGEGSNEVPNFSPDGKRIAFTSDRNGFFDIYTMRANDGGDIQRLTTTNAINDGPKYSPDGQYIVFSSDQNGSIADDGNKSRDLYLMNAKDGSDLRRLTFDMDNRFSRSWSPDGRSIAFSSYKNGVNNIYIIKCNGDIKQVTNVTGSSNPTVPFPGFPKFNGAVTPAWSPDGRYIAYADNSIDPGYQVYRIKLSDSKTVEKLTNDGAINISLNWQTKA